MPQLSRKLIVCCDGTWNEPYQLGAPTNVVKMVRAILPQDANGAAQLVFYHPGVGTGNALDRFMGGTVGIGLSANVQSAYDFLASNFMDGDKIYLFGFSRGAYTARSVAGLVGLVGLLEKREMDLFPFLFDIYRSKEHRGALKSGARADIERAVRTLFSEKQLGKSRDRLVNAILAARPTPIFFIGVWDTVGALGVPFGPLRWIGQSKYNFHDTDLSERIRFAYHALAIDETRKNFPPALWTRPKGRGAEKGARAQTLEQVWFAGVHSNVGGGYPDCGLSDIAFLWMVGKARAAQWSDDKGLPLAFDEQYLREHIDQTMGLLVDSRKGFWAALPRLQRAVCADPGPEKETCEAVHWSAQFRYRCTEQGLFSPYPYRPAKLATALQSKQTMIAGLSELERRYRKWPAAD
jgi:uncharacterized protein (DUF2235 family)